MKPTYTLIGVRDFKPIGAGMMQATVDYKKKEPKWGFVPISTDMTDTVTYRTYVSAQETVVVEARSLSCTKKGYHIPDVLKKDILDALVAEGQADSVVL